MDKDNVPFQARSDMRPQRLTITNIVFVINTRGK
jgi:hypothetical protein